MMLTSHAGVPASPMRLLEMLTDRFGVFEALAQSTIKLNRCTSTDELSMDPQVAEAVLEFAHDLSTAAPPPAVAAALAFTDDARGSTLLLFLRFP
jgi:hypothetical protein